MRQISSILFLMIFCSSMVQAQAYRKMIDKMVAEHEQTTIELRQHFHKYPELSNREFKTAERIEQELRKLGFEVHTKIAHTGVVGVLDTGKPGPTIGLRADIDGLPVVERADLFFKSQEKTEYLGEKVGVMHACGHDTHIAMLLGAAKVLKDMKSELTGKIVFVFQPAEEGAPPGEEGGAELMIKEGLMDDFGIDVMFGQHISSGLDAGKIIYKVGGMMAAADRFVIKVKGKQTHGARPWAGVDPITVSAQIILGLQNIVSRQTELTKEAAVITVGKIKGGVRNNIIPEEVEMTGTIRTLDNDMQDEIHERIRNTATHIAMSAGATAEVDIIRGYPVTFNDPDLTREMLPSLFAAAGEQNVMVTPAITGAEDFSFFAQKVPGLFWFTGGKTPGSSEAFPHHTPDFFIDESGLVTGVKAICYVTMDYLKQIKKSAASGE